MNDTEAGDGRPLTNEDFPTLVNACLDAYGWVEHNIASFDVFINEGIASVVDAAPVLEMVYPAQPIISRGMGNWDSQEIVLGYEVQFGAVAMGPPSTREDDSQSVTLTPDQARVRGITYAAPLFVDIECCRIVQSESGPMKLPKTKAANVFLGEIPIMVGSQQCSLHNLSTSDRMQCGEDEHDPGGYFIINGGEKVVICQERLAPNRVMVFRKASGKWSHVAELRSQLYGRGGAGNVFEVRMHTATATGPASTWKHGSPRSGGTLCVAVPRVYDDVPLLILFRALGLVSDRDWMQTIIPDFGADEAGTMLKLLQPSIDIGHAGDRPGMPRDEVVTEALDYIGKRAALPNTARPMRVQYAREILELELLPHLGANTSLLSKGRFVGLVVRKLLAVCANHTTPDDRDHLQAKRLDTVGPLLRQLFEGAFSHVRRDLEAHCKHCVQNGKPFDPSSALRRQISDAMRTSLATGNWRAPGRQMATRVGVSQTLNRLTYLSMLSHLRRTNMPVGREGKLTRPRQLHNTHWGYVCPAETPEGQAVGLVKNLAQLARVTTAVPEPEILSKVLSSLDAYVFDLPGLVEANVEIVPLDEASHDDFVANAKVFVNGAWTGLARSGPEVVRALRRARRSGDLPIDVSISYVSATAEVHVTTDEGRMVRPLLVVGEDGHLVLTGELCDQIRTGELMWTDLEAMGVVEYIDAAEEETLMIAMYYHEVCRSGEKEDSHAWYQYTHCEIHPSTILGVCAGLIPFPDHNQSPRNCYQSAMCKQAMGVYASNYPFRMDGLTHLLYTPQRPLASTLLNQRPGLRDLPSGVNVIAAIACYGGYNQEDSVVLNQSSVDRGLFRSVCVRRHTAVVANRRVGAVDVVETLGIPIKERTAGLKFLLDEFGESRHGSDAYSKLDEDGVAKVGARVSAGDVIVAKSKPRLDGPDGRGRDLIDCSLALSMGEDGYVDRVVLARNGQNETIVHVFVRSQCVPQIGDKFASRHGQKGTVGITYRQEDMPFTQNGITPELILNPHAIPSRMTIGHLVECLLSKAAALMGEEGDATSFTNVTVDTISRILENFGYQRRGWETMYNGHTGRRLEASIFLGPTYYQRLKHLVDKKIHARARGPVESLTRQPVGGRARDGGLRFGEMERDCMISHGVASILKEVTERSDMYRVHVCDLCGGIAIANLNKQKFSCKACRNTTRISQVYLPYAFKLCMQELMSMSVAVRLAPAVPESLPRGALLRSSA